MGYNKFRYQLIGRVILLGLTIFLFANLFYTESYTFSKILIFLLIGVQGYYLFYFLEKSNRETIGFLQSIKWDDFSHTYPERKEGSSIDELYNEFNAVIKKFREIRAENEASYQYLKTIVQHVGIGIVTFDAQGEVQIINTTARTLLGVKHLKNIKQLKVINEELVTTLRELRTGGRDLVKIAKTDEDEIQLAIYAIELSLRGKEFKLISLQNIQSELEEKEMEAWQNLIRVLTHEIMNSVTPISSLARTIESEMEEWLDNGQDINQIDNEQISDFHTALHTIHRRSESLIKFVGDFRNMTHITLPNFSQVCVKELIGHVVSLLKHDFQQTGVQLVQDVPDSLYIQIDEQQIEQVVINIVKNAIQALGEVDDEELQKTLWIKASERPEGGALISIRDNGPGIEEEALKKIFIPFYTTKKSGSGIGLSLSKQIMRNHRGSIAVRSVINDGTEFTLKFSQ
ncbi:MAG: ATP-binding protein [Marinoscillum sp.]|uniref:sensor histidine kinase n=1 Tax=Marinoscillum sp. TaxID=2024838 RepID=UPI0032F4136B